MRNDDDWDDTTGVERRVPREQGARVLVADDDGAMRGMVVSTLLDDGYEVASADSGDEVLSLLHKIALDAWPADGVDLVIVDNRMPGRTGLDVVRNLRAAHWATPVILMTAFSDPDVVAEAKQLHVPLLAKPFTPQALSHAALSALLRPQGWDPFDSAVPT